VEAPWEIEELLRRTDVGVCLDTGHLLLGGGDPVDAVRSWDGRINHVHLKDARLDVLAGIARDAAPVQEIWRRRAFCRLGDGDVALDRVLDALRDGGYSGWLIVEQDILPGSAGVAQEAAADQVFNRKFLRARGL
jgi:inosose dehydratase